MNCKFLLPGSHLFDTSSRKLGVDYPNQLQADEDALLDFDNRPNDYWLDQKLSYDASNAKTGLKLNSEAAAQLSGTPVLKLFDMKWLSRPVVYSAAVEQGQALSVYAGE